MGYERFCKLNAACPPKLPKNRDQRDVSSWLPLGLGVMKEGGIGELTFIL